MRAAKRVNLDNLLNQKAKEKKDEVVVRGKGKGKGKGKPSLVEAARRLELS